MGTSYPYSRSCREKRSREPGCRMVSQKLVGIRRARVSYLKHLWLDAAYEGGGKRWAEEVLGLSVQIVRKPAKPIPEKVEDLG